MAVLFFYGTLRDEEMRQAVAGRDLAVEPAWLPGFRCVPVKGQSYPMLIRDPQSRSEGVLALDVGRQALQRLMRYEGSQYRLASVTVFKADALPVRARLFVARPNVEGDVNQDWDLKDWQERWKRNLFSRTLGRR